MSKFNIPPTDLRSFDEFHFLKLTNSLGSYAARYRSILHEIDVILGLKRPKMEDWYRMENNNIVLGEVWQQPIGTVTYKHTFHQFSYLYVKSSGLAIDLHGHNEPVNSGKQFKKIKEWYMFDDGHFEYCPKNSQHQLFNPYRHPIYVLSIKIGRSSAR